MSDDDLQLRAQERVGTVLGGKYRIDGVLGVGGMAVVFAATHRNQRRVAVKMLHPGISVHREVRERFLREGYAANTVDHPGAVAVLDDDTAEDGAPFLVMERLEGDEVDRLCQRRGGRLPVDVVLAIADGLLAVLQAAHAKSIVHRDIKPANLYVTHDGSLKVLDFGIARVRDLASGGASATKTGMMLGTPAFMSPEQAVSKSSEIDGRTDLWSVGATLFTLLSGSLVHEGESLTAVIVQAATRPARSLAVALPGVDPRVAAIVDRALAFDKAARWPDAGAMRAAVRAVYLDVFGTRVGREPLEQLFTEAAGSASTVFAPSTPLAGAPPPALAPTGVASSAGTRPDELRSAPPAPPPFVPPWPSHATPPPVSAGVPPASDVQAAKAPRVAASLGPWPVANAPPGSLGPPLASVSAGPDRTGAARDAPREGSRLPAVIVAGATIGACGCLGLVVWWASSARSSALPGPSTEPAITVAASAAAPSAAAPSAAAPSATAPAADEASADPPTAPPSASATSRAAPPMVRPAPLPVVPSVARPNPEPPPAPTVPLAPTYTPPPAPCKAQCTDTARACKASCKAQYHLGHERHQCLVSCETVERDCKSRSPC